MLKEDPEKKDKQEEDVDIVLEQEEKQDGEAPAKEIELDKKETPKQEEKQTVSLDEFNKALKRMEYQSRQAEKLRKELKERDNTVRQVLIGKKEGEEIDPLDEIAQKDWKKAVRMLAQQELQEQAKVLKKQEENNKLVSELENSKSRVREKYPQLDDENSEEARLYIDVINENPNLSRNPYGPELAMYKMEEKMRTMGKVPPQVKAIVDKESSAKSDQRFNIILKQIHNKSISNN